MSRVGSLKWPLIVGALLIGGLVIAQDYQRRSGRDRYGGGERYGSDYDERGGVPLWENTKDFEHDVFTFVRIQYDSHRGKLWLAWRSRRR